MMTRSRVEIIFRYSFFLLLATASLILSLTENDEEEVQRNQFPDGFLFGTATSAYQIEGAYLEDGKGLSNWDVFTHVPGNIRCNDNGDIADDHYHRYLDDIELMHSLGVNAYRFSISWARILPGGKFGDVNPKGIMFYNKIIDNLLLRGIKPFVTIYHFDLPQILEDRYGGWLNPLIQEEFVYFSRICFQEFGDRVKYWATINEPIHLSDFAYVKGSYPPGHCSPPFGNCLVGDSDTEPLIAVHNMLISHAMAADTYVKHFQLKQGGFIGIVVNAFMYEPLRDEEVDRQAVSRAFAFSFAWALDPLLHGDYPPEMLNCIGLELPRFSPTERELLKSTRLDFIGLNHYTTLYVKDCIYSGCSSDSNRPIRGFLETTGERDGTPIGQPTGKARFYVVPRGMEKVIDYVRQRYNNKLMFITENGFASPIQQNEQVKDLLQDHDRVKYHKAYLSALASAIRNGANVRGYFLWSLMDNFEWGDGYETKFGLYHVDRATLERSPKVSARWYSNFLKNDSTANQNYEQESSKNSFPKKINASLTSRSEAKEAQTM